MKVIKNITLLVTAIGIHICSSGIAQSLDSRIHDRGTLHETVYNDGTIGRPWQTGEAGNRTTRPLMEWPSRSAVILDGIEYSGQHNLLGAGMYMAANLDGKPGKPNRIYSLCGGVGASSPETSVGRWSFPISIEEIENYPILEDGTLNPDYDPNEAEEIIIAKWASSLGITVTRTSRAYSHPDYDDFIIYEYELEYTGDTDGNPATIERNETLKDFMALFIYGFAPSMYGYQRHYQEWKYEAGIYRGDQNGYWDSQYWLGFNLNLRTNLLEKWAKPEPNYDFFKLFSETGRLGGGLCSPQAPGVAVLYYDVNHLAVVDPEDPQRNESEVVDVLRTSGGQYFEFDENGHIKQPWSNKVSTGNTNSQKMKDNSINPDNRWSGVYSEGSTTWPDVPSPKWYGRAAFNYRQSVDAGQKHIVFGPYTLHPGDKLEYSLAEIVGYGGQAGKRVEGGPPTSSGTLVQWNTIPSWNRKITVDGVAWTDSGYIDQYGIPDYVNSNVVTVQQVAHKAFEAYLGTEPTVPVWPEDNPKDGSYQIPITVPAPAITTVNTAKAEVDITWSRDVEDFTAPRLTGNLDHFNLYRSIMGMGPWQLIASIPKGQVNSDGIYEFLDTDDNFKILEERYYAVTSVDDNGNESGKSNITRHVKNIGAVEKLSDVFVVPNPFIVNSGFEGSGEVADKLGFYKLPKRCTIRVFSYAGQLVRQIEHNDPVYSTEWLQITRNTQEIASGIYFYVVTTPEGDKTSGKFVVVK
jgi:hypothetical protein